jgi:hypothetical protein
MTDFDPLAPGAMMHLTMDGDGGLIHGIDCHDGDGDVMVFDLPLRQTKIDEYVIGKPSCSVMPNRAGAPRAACALKRKSARRSATAPAVASERSD